MPPGTHETEMGDFNLQRCSTNSFHALHLLGKINLVPRAFPLKVGGAGEASFRPSHLQGKRPGNEVGAKCTPF